MYPSIPKRVKASLIDSVILMTSIVLIMTVYSHIGIETPIIGLIIFSVFLFYEPILVSWKGRTIGHRIYKFKVVDVETVKNIGLAKAIVRFLIKISLGIVSLFWAFFTNRQQSLHDVITNSVVISSEISIESIEINGLPEIPFAESQEDIIQASITRRVIVSALWFIMLFFVVSIIYGLSVPAECLDDTSSSINYCKHSDDVLGYVFVGIVVLCLALGAKGKLLGARSKNIKPNVLDASS